eukprot:6114934-Pleurochrysis_carterae.AAC.1
MELIAAIPTGHTPAHDGMLPVKRYHADSLGLSRDGSSAVTSVDDFMWYHQKDVGSMDVASLA